MYWQSWQATNKQWSFQILIWYEKDYADFSSNLDKVKNKNEKRNCKWIWWILRKWNSKMYQNWNKNHPSRRWRSVKQIWIKYTYILQTWYYEEKTYTQKFICPLGMVKYMKKVLIDQKLCHCALMSFQMLSKKLFYYCCWLQPWQVKNSMWGWRVQGLWQLLCFILLYLLKGQAPRLNQKIQRSFAWKPKDWGYSGTSRWTHHCW